MLPKVKWKNPKEKIKMKGLYTPQVIILLLGMIDHHKGLIIEQGDGSYESPFLNKKTKDLHDYTAKMYKCTSQLLAQQVMERERVLNKLEMTEQKLEEVSKTEYGDNSLQVAEGQAFETFKKERLEKRRQACLCRLKEIEEVIQGSETETAEIILSCRRKMEGLFTTYLSGAHKVISRKALEIPSDQTAVEIYRRHVRERTADQASEVDLPEYIGQ